MSTAPVTPIRPAQAPTRYLSPEQVCDIVPGMTVASLKDMRSDGRGPAFHKPTGERGKITLYLEADVLRWIERSRVSTTEQS